MLKLVLSNILACIMLVFSLMINVFGGLYTHSYIRVGDLYKISDLQGTGDSDFVILVLGSFVLLLLMTIINFIQFISIKIKTYSMIVVLVFAFYLFNLMETGSFLDISYATIFKSNNLIYSAWFSCYILICIVVFLNLLPNNKKTPMTLLKDINSL